MNGPRPCVILVIDCGLYIKRHADTDCGRGFTQFAASKAEAKRFPSFSAAFEYWRQRSATVPTRPDGMPNRPLTAFTVEIQPVEDAHPGAAPSDNKHIDKGVRNA